MANIDNTVGLALYGLGRIGQIHIKNIIANQRIKLKWVVEENTDVARDTLASYGVEGNVSIAKTADIHKVLQDKSVQAVFICTPTDTHAELSIQALRAGKHVLCEKPISEETSKIVECYDVADECKKVLMAAFNRQFDKSYKDIFRRVRDGEIGDVHFVRSTFRDCPLWLGCDSFSQTFLSHDAGIQCWIADALPISLVCIASANIKEIKDNKDVDCIVVTMTFPNGSIGVMDASRSSCYGYDIRLEVFGSKGMLKMDQPYQTTVTTYSTTGCQEPPREPSFPERFTNAYVTELEHFIDVIQGKAELEVPRQHNERVAIVCDAIRKSYETKQIVYL